MYHWRHFNETIESLLELSKGFYEGTQNHREGLVLRPTMMSDGVVCWVAEYPAR